jgi:hypothetical protein
VNLEQLQRAVFEVTRQPLTASEEMRPHLPDGRSVREIANALIKPNDRLSSFERLQIYNQQYWFRILASFSEDFPGLRNLVGERRFEKLSVAYLNECPSESYTLRNLGTRLETWLQKHPEYVAGVERIANDMVRVEWADIEAFDGPELPRFCPDDPDKLGAKTVFHLQPHLHLLELAYPVDDLLLRIKRLEARSDAASNAVLKFPRQLKIRRSSLPRPRKIYLTVYRLNRTVYYKRLPRAAFVLLQALRDGKSLEKALDASLFGTRRSVDRVRAQVKEWFQDWSYLGWFAHEP